MNEITRYDVPGVVAPFDLDNPTGGRLVAWASALSAAYKLGSALAATSFVPKEFRGKPEECAAAILYGDEVGLTPMQALQAVYVVSGRPGLYARVMVALVQSRGHEVEQVSASDAKVVVRGRRAGSDVWVVSEWTTERARRAGYTQNKKYETDPQAMLYARAAGEVCRKVAPDALAGLAYTVEELQLAEAPAPARVRREVVRDAVAVRRAVESAPEPAEPTFDVETGEMVEQAVEQVDDTGADASTQAQQRRLAILLGEMGIGEREARLLYVSERIGRVIGSSRDLDKAEASALINDLEAMLAESRAPRPEALESESSEPTFDEVES